MVTILLVDSIVKCGRLKTNSREDNPPFGRKGLKHVIDFSDEFLELPHNFACSLAQVSRTPKTDEIKNTHLFNERNSVIFC